MSAYLKKFKSLCVDLTTISKPLSNSNKVLCVLNGLGREYDPFVTIILKPPISTY